MDEAILQEAIDALDSQEFASERAAVRHFDAKRGTLRDRRSGRLPRNKAFQKFQKLSPEEEQYLLAWIQAEDLAGTSPSFSRIRAMANRMYQNQTSPPDRSKQLGKNWIDGLKKRHPQLVTRKVRRVDS